MGAAIQSAAGGRRGRRAGRGRRLAEINVTPFVDVMLVLLIVFMVTAPLLTVGIKVELPKTTAPTTESETEPLTVTITADGVVFLQETPIEVEALVAQMRAISDEGYDRQVYVRGDAKTPYGLFADVVARINTGGFRKLTLVTDTQDTPPQ